jgi:site-specific recombinase XerC
MVHTWKALAARFENMNGTSITIADSRAHIAERRQKGIKDWTIYTELSHLRNVLKWAVNHDLLRKRRTSSVRRNEMGLTEIVS